MIKFVIMMKNFNSAESFNEPLMDTEHFKVIPSLGALVEGWLLIVPKQHCLNLGLLQSEQLYDELEFLSSTVRSLLRKKYGPVVAFEHGPSEPNKLVGCGVDYAHLHIVPFNGNLIEKAGKLLDLKYDWLRINNISETRLYAEKDKPYLFVHDQDDNLSVCTANAFPSQLFRKVIACELGTPEKFDWKCNPNHDLIFKTIQSVKDEVSRFSIPSLY
jgi:ATP adenylyltransferase